MKREFKGIQRKGLPGGPHEQFTYVTGVFMQDMYHVPEAQNELEKYQTKGEFNFNDLIRKYQKSGWESLTKDEQDLYRDNYDNLYYDEKQKSWRSDKPVVEVTADATGRYKELKDYKNWLTDWYSSDIAKDMMTEGYKKEYEGTDFEGSVDPRQLAQENLQERIKNITGNKKLKHVDPNLDKRVYGYVRSQSENTFKPIREESRNISDIQKNINFLDRAYFDAYIKTYDYDIFDNVRELLKPEFGFRHKPISNKLRSLFYKNALKKAYQDQLEVATQRNKEWDETFNNSNLPSDYDSTDYPKKEDIVKQTIKLDDLNDEFKTIYYRPDTKEYAIPHELGHLSTGSLNLIPNQDIRLIQEEVPYMSIAAKRNELLQRFGPRDLFGNPIKKENVGKPTESQHGFFRSLPYAYNDNPTEVQTRLNVARYQAKDKIGWDPLKRKATMEDVMKLKEIDELQIQDLFTDYSPEHILKMLNSIVMEDTGNDMYYGQNGLEKYQFKGQVLPDIPKPPSENTSVQPIITMSAAERRAMEARAKSSSIIPRAVQYKFGIADPIESSQGFLTSKDTTIDLTNRPMDFARVNEFGDGRTIIGGDFIESNNNAVRKASDWLNAPEGDTYSDQNLQTKDVESFYGIEDNKFKVGKAEDFKSETLIVPRRYGAKNISKAVLNEEGGLRILDNDGNPIYQNVGLQGKFILYSPTSKKSEFNFIESGASGVDKVNTFTKNNPDAQIIVLDNGRYAFYGDNPAGLTEQNFLDYYSQDLNREGYPGYNLIVKQDGGDLPEYQYQGGYFDSTNTFIPTYALPEITVTPETVKKFNLAEKQKRKDEYRTNYQAILDEYNAEDLSGSSGFKKIKKAIKNDLIKAGYTEEEAIEKRNAIIKDMLLNESFKNKNLIYNSRKDEFYKDLTDQELGFVLNYYDPDKMEEQLKDFEATEILGGDFVSHDGSALSRPASFYRDLNWQKDYEELMSIENGYNPKRKSYNYNAKNRFFNIIPTEKENVYRIGSGNHSKFNVKDQHYWAVENGKIKAGTIDKFNENTIVTPISVQGSKILTKDNVYNFEEHDVFRERPAPDEKPNPWLSKHIFYSPTTGKSAFISGQKNANKFVEENTDAIPIPLDHGRWGIRFEAEDGDVMYGADYKDYVSGHGLTSYRGDLDKGVGDISDTTDHQKRIFGYEGYNVYIKPPKPEYPELEDPKKASSYKKVGGEQEIIVSKDGQYAHPGKITRIPGNNITMKGVPYPVFAIPNVGMPTMMQSGQDYYFPDADYVDEIPMMQDGNGEYNFQIPGLRNRMQYDDQGNKLYGYKSFMPKNAFGFVTPTEIDPLSKTPRGLFGAASYRFPKTNISAEGRVFQSLSQLSNKGQYDPSITDVELLAKYSPKPGLSVQAGPKLTTVGLPQGQTIFDPGYLLETTQSFPKLNLEGTLGLRHSFNRGPGVKGGLKYMPRSGNTFLTGEIEFDPSVFQGKQTPRVQVSATQKLGVRNEERPRSFEEMKEGGALPKYQISGPENIDQIQSDNTRTQRQKIINPVYTLPEVTVYPNMDAFGRRLPTISEAEPFDYSRYLSHPHEFLPRNLAENPIIDLTNEVFNPFNWTYDIDKGVNNLVDGNYKQGALQIVDGIPIGGNPYKIFKGGYKGAKNVLRNILKQLGIEQVESEFTEEEEKIDVLPFLDVSKVKASDVKKDGGAIAKKQLNSDLLKTYKNYINGVDESAEAVRAYDKLNRIFYKESKLNNMSAPNYIMTHIIPNA